MLALLMALAKVFFINDVVNWTFERLRNSTAAAIRKSVKLQYAMNCVG